MNKHEVFCSKVDHLRHTIGSKSLLLFIITRFISVVVDVSISMSLELYRGRNTLHKRGSGVGTGQPCTDHHREEAERNYEHQQTPTKARRTPSKLKSRDVCPVCIKF